MNNLEDKLIKIKTKKLTEDDKSFIWHGTMMKVVKEGVREKPLLINIFKNYMKYNVKKMILGVLAVMIILGGGGVVVASNNSLPGDVLFPVDLAVEKVKISLASENKKSDLKLKFAEERISEIKNISNKKSMPTILVADLSGSTVTEVEVDVFSNETLVKIEANDRKYGYVSLLKTKENIVKEISEKYSLDEAKVTLVLDFEIEDRASGADDRKFLNKTHSVNFSKGESNDVGVALTSIERLLKDSDDKERSQKIEQSLKELLVLLGDDADIEVKKDGDEIRIQTVSGDKIKIELNDDDSKNDDKDDDSSDDSDDKDDDKGRENNTKSSDDSILNIDIRENSSEVFCRGEWRDVDDCNGDSSDDSDDNSNDDDESSDEDEEDEDDSDDSDDDDNSGHGGGNDDEDDN